MKTQHDLENYILLGDLITVIIGYIEIDKFKNEKQYRYYNVMQVVSNMQYNLNQKVQKKNKLFWNCIDLLLWSKVHSILEFSEDLKSKSTIASPCMRETKNKEILEYFEIFVFLVHNKW